MAGSKKAGERPKDSAALQVSLEDFVRTRDRVITGFATLQNAVQELSQAYVVHTNTVIGSKPVEQFNFPALPGEKVNHIATPIQAGDVKETKKRKRKPPEKDAPKRPVTAFFLYMQNSRAIIHDEMGSGATPGEVSEEGLRRWNSLSDEEKKQWGKKYAVNFVRYKEKVKAYKAGRPIPDISDSEAQKLYDEKVKSGEIKGEIDLEPGPKEVQEEEDDDDDDDEETSDDSKSPSSEEEVEPVKEPSPPKSSRASKRQKGVSSEKKPFPAKQVADDENELIHSPATGRVSTSPEVEKKKRSSKQKEIPQPKLEPGSASINSPPNLTTQDSQQKPKKSKRKRKNEALEE